MRQSQNKTDRRKDGYSMNSTQFRKALADLGLTQAQAAEWLGLSIRAVHGYANGAPIPEPTAKLLRLMVKLDLKPKDVR